MVVGNELFLDRSEIPSKVLTWERDFEVDSMPYTLAK